MEDPNFEFVFGLISVIVTALRHLTSFAFFAEDLISGISPLSLTSYSASFSLQLIHLVKVLLAGLQGWPDRANCKWPSAWKQGNCILILICIWQFLQKIPREYKPRKYSHHWAKSSHIVLFTHIITALVWFPCIQQSCDCLSRFGVFLTVRLTSGTVMAILLFFFTYPWKFPGGNFTLSRSVTHKR